MSNITTTSAPPEDTTAKDRAADTAEAVKQGASELASTAKEQATDVVRDAREQASDLLHKSRSELRNQASEQTERLASTLHDFTGQLHAMARGDGAPKGVVADITNELASRVDHAATKLQQDGFDGALEQVKRFARQRPGAFLLGALGAGFAIGRVLRVADTKAIADAAKPSSGDDGSATHMSNAAPAAALPPPRIGANADAAIPSTTMTAPLI